MFWLTPPPYLRRAAALVVLVVAVFIEFRPTATELIPVASSELSAGSEVTAAHVRWLAIEPGLEAIRLPAVLARDVASGEPITPSDLDATVAAVPDDWLRLGLPVPETTSNGNRIVMVLPATVTDRPISGIVVSPPFASDFGGLEALVAFAPGDAVLVARGLAEGEATALLGR